ncbi:methyltransferase domain-containing protein [Amycolatopsis sp. NPDC059027]|uniref:methyltransferase domain-containing protein n=1 Tax=unclassified Amycolatopsis TaxID=2618356 RepID=UPI003672CDBA
MTIERLVAQLDSVGAMPAAWREAFLAVPRHRFLPPRFWVDDDQGEPRPISRDDDPDLWLESAYLNVPVLTQFDDGRTVWPAVDGAVCTSSASQPDLVLSMLAALDVHDGQRVLEIGTGTGYNAAIMAARLGAGNVVTVEIDAELADRARNALADNGFPVTVVTGDGAEGYRAGAPYDRVLATAAVRVGELPAAWLEQTKPGGVIVAPMRTDFSGSLPLVRFAVDEHGIATGSPVGRVGFMAVRAQRTPDWTVDDLDPDDPAAEASTTTLKPWRVAESHDVRWAVGVRVPNCVWEHRPPVGEGGDHLLWLRDPTGESWAVARYSDAPGPRLIRQYGPRRLWDEVEAAFRAWAAEGKPPVDAWRVVVTPETAER